MRKIKDNIFWKRFGYFNVYVIKGPNGDVLIDTGFLIMRKRLCAWLDKFNIKLIILTHAHIDHIWNAKYIKDRYGCQIAMGEEDIENIDNSKIKSHPVNYRYKYRTKLMNWGMRHFKPDVFDVDIKVKDQDEIDLNGLDIKFITLKGHTNGSIGVLYKDVLFAGDALVNRKLRAEIAYQNQNNEESINSAKKIIKFNPQLILIGHESPIKIDKLKKSINSINNYNLRPKKKNL